jgi:hypothetical protein
VHLLQDRLKLYSLSPSVSGLKTIEKDKTIYHNLPPVEQIKALNTLQYFERLMELMVENPPQEQDKPMVKRLARAGLIPGQFIQLNSVDHFCFSLGRWLANEKIKRALDRTSTNGRWNKPPLNLGQYGTDYNTRAVVAMIGLGANLPEDALYPNTSSDHEGQALSGKHVYQIHFDAQTLPPVQAFWSITAYGSDEFLIDNPINRFAVGDRDKLHYNKDGSLDIWIQASEPTDPSKRANWLPIKANTAFLLNARLYWPKASALQGDWEMPPVIRLGKIP